MCRRLERCWRGSGLSIDREMYLKQCKVVNERIHQSKMRYYSGIIEENKSEQKNLFVVVNRVLYSKAEKKLPMRDDQSQLAEEFADFFTEKISKIRMSLELKRAGVAHHFPGCVTAPVAILSEFNDVTSQELSDIIRSNAVNHANLTLYLPRY